ncbi:MAG: serine/threonine protein kinase [Magnetococcus sp. DMHC-8]
MVTHSTVEPARLGRYQLVRMLDHGGSGLVYEGWDPVRQQQVAIKTIHPSLLAGPDGQRLRERCRDEARILGACTHPNIATLFEYGEEQGAPVMVLELLQGRTLKECLEAGLSFEVGQSVDLLYQVLDAVACLHANGIMHLDLKPANMILLPGERLKVMDFGIARREDAPDAWHGTITGTPGYMAPEQLMGQPLDRRSDLFATGVIFYELLTGVKPFPGRQVPNIIQRVLNLSPDPPSLRNHRVPPALDGVALRALAKQPTDRFQDAESFRDAIRQALAQPT